MNQYNNYNDARVSLNEAICAYFETFANGPKYQRIAYDIIDSDRRYYFSIICPKVKEAVDASSPTRNVPRRYIEKCVDYWTFRLAVDYLTSLNRPLDDIERYALDDMSNRLNELNVGNVNQINVGTRLYSTNNNVADDPNIFLINRDNNKDSIMKHDRLVDRSTYDNMKNSDAILDIINRISINDTNNDPQTQQPESMEVSDTSGWEDVDLVTKHNNIILDGSITPIIDVEPIDSKNGDGTVHELTNEPMNNAVIIDMPTVTKQEKDNGISKYLIKEYTSMTEDARVDYITHELNEVEIKRYNEIANYSTKIIPLLKEETDNEKPDSIIKTEDLYLINKLVYLPQVADVAGSDEYYDCIHADGKGVISVFGEYGATSGVYISNDATISTITDFNNKIFSIDNLNVLIKQLKESGRGGNILCNAINYKLVSWIHDMMIIPVMHQSIPLLLSGDFERDLTKYIDFLQLDVDTTCHVLMNHIQSLCKYMPMFERVQTLYIGNNHLPILDILPIAQYRKCIIPLNYTVMVRIPVDFKALGLDPMHCETPHFIAPRSSYEQFFLLEENIYKTVHEISSSIKNIKLNIADTSGHVVEFKRVEEAIAIIKLSDR